MRSLFFVIALLGTAPLSVAWAETPISRAIDAFNEGDSEQAQALLEPMAAEGDPEALYMLGSLYLYGEEEVIDPGPGIAMLKSAAEKGHYEAANAMAKVFLSGLGVKRDEEEALKWFNLAAEIAAREGHNDGDCR